MADFVEQDLGDQKIRQFEEKFKTEGHRFADKPVQKRSCTDPCCLGFFLLMFFAFLIYSAVSINHLAVSTDFTFQKLNTSFLENVEFKDMKTFATIVLSMFAASIVIGVVLFMAMFYCADKILLMMALSGVAIISACAVYLAIQGDVLGEFSTYFFVLAFLYAGFVCALREYLEKAAILTKTIAIFILENLRIMLLVVITLIYCLILVILWTFGLYSFIVLHSNDMLSYSGFVWSSVFWAFILFFFIFYFYYTSVFLTSYSLAIWFYQKEDMDNVGTPLKHAAVYHLGTITFASLMISVLRVIKVMIFFSHCRKGDGIFGLLGACCSCIVCFCLGGFEAVIQVMNTYAVVTCALTGQSFQEAAYTAGHIAYTDYEAFSAFAYTGYVLQTGAAICVGSIPAIVGTILLTSNIDNSYLVIVGSLICFFICATIGQVILQVFLESIHTLYMMFRMDTELQECGHEVTWVEEFGRQLNAGFDEAFIGQIKKKPKPKYKKVTTIVVHQNGATQVYKNRVMVEPMGQQKVYPENDNNTFNQL